MSPCIYYLCCKSKIEINSITIFRIIFDIVKVFDYRLYFIFQLKTGRRISLSD